MGKIKVILGAAALLFSSIVNASIISGNLMTDGGKEVNLSGLEWMSFDHFEDGIDFSTFGIDEWAIDDAGTIWANDGWELATEVQVNSLWQSLELTSGQVESNNDGATWFINAFGALQEQYVYSVSNSYRVTIPDLTSSTGIFRSQTPGLFGVLSIRAEYTEYYRDISDPDPLSPVLFTNHLGTLAVYDPLRSCCTNAGGVPDAGAFFVRALSVPEPSIIALMFVGLFGLGLSRRRIRNK